VARVDEVLIHHRRIPLKRPFVTAIRTAYEIDALIVEVRDSDGRSGWGEAPASWRVTGESAESITAAICGPLSDAIDARATSDPGELSASLSRVVARNSSARMALDCALYDLAAQEAGVPLFHYLGGRAPSVRTDVTLSAVVDDSELDEVLGTALEFVHGGARTLKVKVGAGGDDVRTLVAVRHAVGPSIHLRVDANQGWERDQAIRIVNAFEDAGVDLELVEQPVSRDDIEGLAQVTAHVGTPVMADEAIWSKRELLEIIRMRAADMVNVKLAKTGGLREALDVVRLAIAGGVTPIVGCMAESHVGVAAGAALASVIDSDQLLTQIAHDLDGGLLLEDSPVEGGVHYEQDRVELNLAPGTGIQRMA
jgi:L-alanine-DL-glutamate epimerase-like enolase superfamily enzyme